jgi:decaprenyl-phosphate phosphoribosyltransferase
MHKIKALIRIARPYQYVKNFFVFLPLLFGYKIKEIQPVVLTLYAFFVFCLAASSVYVLNDIKDIAEDARHPVKRRRPLPSGELSKSEAIVFFLMIVVLSLLIAYLLLPVKFIAVLAGYLLLNLAYSQYLKHHAIVDVVCIAVGFVLRVCAGGFAAGIYISHWIVIMTFLLALFLAFAKRRDDIILSENGHDTRKCIDGYNIEFVSASMGFMASIIIVSYLLYTLSPEIIDKHGTNQLYLTAFWVIIGILRYMQITFVENRSGSPTLVLLKDYLLQAVVILWIINVYLLLYVM